jgi:putative serine/threonine protein kinase
MDADRPDLLHEAHILSKTNAINIGPKLIGSSKNFLLTQLIDGDHLPNWLKEHKNKTLVQKVLGEVLEQCWQLDEAGLDHGELSKAPKHIIIDHKNKPWLIDFETASDTRKPANVTAICNFLFSGAGEVARTITEIIGDKNREEIIGVLKSYRKGRSRDNFEKILQTCLR